MRCLRARPQQLPTGCHLHIIHRQVGETVGGGLAALVAKIRTKYCSAVHLFSVQNMCRTYFSFSSYFCHQGFPYRPANCVDNVYWTCVTRKYFYAFKGIPYVYINPATKEPSEWNTYLSKAGGTPLEYLYLWGITGRTEYKDRVMKIR